jgi:hypothetical protein
VLTNVNGLSALTKVGGYVNFYSNAALTNLDGLASLASIGTTTSDYLQISGNTVLASIAGLISPNGVLHSLAGNLTVTSNAKLSSCQADALKSALLTSSWAGTYSQSSNLACAGTCNGTLCQ